MSVIFNASKNNKKNSKPKKKRLSSAGVTRNPPTPPVSSSNTVVWHWQMEGQPITVMLSKDSNKLWCNGEDVDTNEGFSDDGDGGKILFFIPLDGIKTAHQAHVKIIGGSRGMQYFLEVNGAPIIEHKCGGTSYQENDTTFDSFDTSEQPSYEENDDDEWGF